MRSSNSLRELDRVEDRLRQHRQVVNAPIVIVEGPDDQLVLKKHIEPSIIFPADGKRNVLRAIRALSNWGESALTAIIDVDFDDSTELAELADLVYPYEKRDLEGMLIALGVLASVLEHQGSSAKLKGCGGTDQLINRLVHEIAPVTAMRHANGRARLGLAFDRVKVGDKMQASTLKLGLTNYCAALLQASETEVDQATLDAAIAEYADDDALGPRGRDVVEVAGVALRRVAGSLQAAAATEEVLTRQVHSSSGLALSTSDWIDGLKRRILLSETSNE